MQGTRTIKLLAGVAALTAIAAPSCVPVSAPSATGSFIACYKESGGAVRFINAGEACDQGEKQATWNQTGPQGPQGPQGVTGATGANGNGPVYTNSVLGGGPIEVYPAYNTVLSVAVPAGYYLLEYSGFLERTFNNVPSSTDYGRCQINDGAGNPFRGGTIPMTVTGGVMAIHTARWLPGGVVTVECSVQGNIGNQYYQQYGSFTVTRVTAVNP